MIKYRFPDNWIKYDKDIVNAELVQAKATILSIVNTPYQRSWVESLQKVQLKIEVAGTSRIEGAEFTDVELEQALDLNTDPKELITRSQRQARAAVDAYTWLSKLEDGQPITEELIKEIHRLIVKDCDDDHCEPGELRKADINVIFGSPSHRGDEGGRECQKAFSELVNAVNSLYKGHDLLVQALALHYHFAAIHPFLDGNGRTARALEALVLQKAGLRDSMFIAMSNYYYDEKPKYLEKLSLAQQNNHDLTEFILFGLEGITKQSSKLFIEIKKNMQKALFRNMMYDLFNRLKNKRKRVIVERQLEILNTLLDSDTLGLEHLWKNVKSSYVSLNKQDEAFFRDLAGLVSLDAIKDRLDAKGNYYFSINLEWPTEITESKFFEIFENLPKAKTYSFFK